MQRNIIFDLDGTLVRTGIIPAWIDTLAELGMNAKEAEEFALARQGMTAIATLRDLHLPADRVAALEQRFWQAVSTHPATPLAHADDLLRTLDEEGFRLYLSTGSTKELAAAILAEQGWTELFRLALGSDETDPKGPGHYRQFVADAGVSPDEFGRHAATVGDGVYDMRYGREHAVALRVGLVEGSQEACDRLVAAGANVLIDELVELPPLLKLL